MSKDLNITFRIWVFRGEKKLIGKGRVELLERIKNTGSILKAAQGMKMSYRQAWQMVEEMNERASSRLVEKKLGGKSGGGAMLTKAGEGVIKMFRDMEKDVAEYIRKKSKNIKI